MTGKQKARLVEDALVNVFHLLPRVKWGRDGQSLDWHKSACGVDMVPGRRPQDAETCRKCLRDVQVKSAP